MINYTPQRMIKALGLTALMGLCGLVNAQTSQALDWAPAGPVYNAGRARNMVVEKNNSNVLYVGSTSSGIFKSLNGGGRWRPVNDQATIRNISYMAQAADGKIYVGTGEGFLRPGQQLKALPGTGLYFLNETNTPATLDLVVSNSVVGTVINKVACTQTGNNVAIATNLGVFVSVGGSAFTQVTLPGAPTGTSATPTGTNVMGLDVKFDSNGILYCSIGAVAAVGTSSLGGSKVYRSVDASLGSFSDITPASSVLSDLNYGRIELAIAPSDNNVIYASCANKYTNVASATLKALFVSYNAGSSWALIQQGTPQLDPTSFQGILASGDYAQSIIVSPTNPHQIFFGSFLFYSWTRTNNSNTNPVGDWLPLSQMLVSTLQNYIHENIHDIKYVPSANIFYFITDAGIFRSVDLGPLMGNLYVNATWTSPPSYQPFYKGMVTGQFNSVSIQRFPIGSGIGIDTLGARVTPFSGFVGGTGGNGLTYYSGTDSLVTSENSYIGGEIYNTEFSKILPDAVITSPGNGTIYRSSNIKNSPPTRVKANSYANALSKIAPNPDDLVNTTTQYTTTGTPFRLWENYGQINSPDSAVFYNDTVRYQASMSGIVELTTTKNFTFSTSRPNQYAMIDSVVVRTGTVQLPIDNSLKDLGTPFNGPNDRQTIYVKLPNNYTITPTGNNTLSVPATGASTLPVTFTLNTQTLIDNFQVQFPLPPFATKTITQYPPTATGTAIIVPDAAAYYRVFATVYYSYKAGDVVSVVDNNISTKTNTYTAVLSSPLNWHYGSFPTVYTLTASSSTVAVTNPTMFVLSNLNPTIQTVNATSVTVTPYATANYTLQEYGTFTVNAKPVTHTLSITPFSYVITATNTATSFTLLPSAITNTTGSFTVYPTSSSNNTYTIKSPGTGTTIVSEGFTLSPTSFSLNPATSSSTTSAPNVFLVSPTTSITYTISQATGTMTQESYSTIGTPTYVLTSGTTSVTQSYPTFTLNTGTSPIIYTITGTSPDPNTGANTSVTIAYPLITTTVVSPGAIPIAPNNNKLTIPSRIGARIAMILNNSGNTGSMDAIVVSKNPLALNDPLSFVRISETNQVNPPGNLLYTDDANGHPTTNTIAVIGKPTLLEWSKSGTELYYATIPVAASTPSVYQLYRVSHINTIMDLSPSSYSGKFYNDIYRYAAPINSSSLNPVSPFRTTLVGTFDKPITSISVSNDSSKFVVLTFNGASTGTTSTVMYNTNDIRKATQATAGWVAKGASLPSSVTITYCSLTERKNDKMVFVGTDNGIIYTNDITASNPVWSDVNVGTTSPLPKVQVFDMKQQTISPWDCYNSGQIYVATNGRGIWTNSKYLEEFTVGINEIKKPVEGKNLSIYPNPTNGDVFINFNSMEGENAHLQVYDISGRLVYSENLGKLNSGETTYSFGTSQLNSGIYMVNVNSDSGIKRVTKLIVTK